MRTRTSYYDSATSLSLARGLLAALFCGVLAAPEVLAQEVDICAGVAESDAGASPRSTCAGYNTYQPNWLIGIGGHIPGAGEFNRGGSLRTINVRVIVWMHSNSLNFAPADSTFLRNALMRVQDEYWSNLHVATDPSPRYDTLWPGIIRFPDACPWDTTANWYACFDDTRLRINITGIHFIAEDTMAMKGCDDDPREELNQALVDHYGLPHSVRDLKLHVTLGPCGGQGAAFAPIQNGSRNFGPDPAMGVTSRPTDSEEFLARHWAHELGHCLGLLHTYRSFNGAGCTNPAVFAEEFCSDPSPYYLHDVLGFISTNPFWTPSDAVRPFPLPDSLCSTCSPAFSLCHLDPCNQCSPDIDPWDRCTNNLMGNNSSSRFTSPLQMGRMHSMLMLSGISRNAWGYDSIPFRFESLYELYQAQIVNTFTIDHTVKFYQDVHVPAGVVVTVKCEVDMVPEARWVVEPGGKLIIDGGIIRAAVFAPQRWRGVEVWGVNDQANVPHSVTALANAGLYEHHGVVQLINGGEIQDAEIGILSGSRDDPSQGGGVIQVDGTDQEIGGYIRNCPIGVELKPYNVKSTASRFTNAHFLWDEDALPGDLGTNLLEHMRIVDVAGSIPIRGCTFANELSTHTESIAMGHGINGHNARIVVDDQCPGNNSCPNTFRDLDHGIHATSTGNGRIRIQDNEFIDNICGVYLNGTVAASIMNNVFEMGRWNVVMDHPVELNWLDRHRAIFTTVSYGFTIKDNTIAPSQQADPAVSTEGIVAGYTYDHNDVVYRNSASGLERGFVGEGISADVYGGQANWIGLHFECNENEGNATNLFSRKANGDPAFEEDHTIRGNQGSNIRAAGNRFGSTPATWDLEMNTTRLPVLVYHFGVGTVDQPPQTFTQDVGVSEWLPVEVNSGPIQVLNAENPCNQPQGAIGGLVDLLLDLEESRQVYASTRYLYDQLIDDGSTDELVLEITSTWPQNMLELRDRLLGLSPYLSTASLMSLVETAGVPDAIKAEVCIANPEATRQEGFIEWAADEAMYPLPGYIIENIVASWYVDTYRGATEALMAGQHTDMTQAVNTLVQFYEDADDVDSVLWAWGRLRTNAARYAEAAALMAEGRYAEADSLVQAMPEERDLREKEETERTRMLAYMGILAGADAQDRSTHQLDSAEVAQLAILIGEHYDRPAVWASNLLCTIYGICRAPYTGGDVEPKAQKPRGRKKPVSSASMLTAHPNPADTWVALGHHVPGNTAPLQLVVRDMAGRVVQTFTAGGAQGQTLWDIRGMAAGVHSVELLRDGRTLDVVRVVLKP